MATELQFDPIAEARRHWEERWGSEVTPSMAAVTSIMRVQQILIGRLNAMVSDLDLTFARYEALMLLLFSSRGSLPLGKIGDRLQVHRTSVTNLIDGLERSGYVRRVAHESDRRTTLAEITPEGTRGRRGRHGEAERSPLRHRLRRVRGPRDHLPAARRLSRPI